MKLSKRILKPAITLFFIGAMLASASLWPSVQVATGASPQATIKIPKISITITFGRAKKKCGGFGICKITFGKSIALANARSLRAELSPAGDGKLQLTLLDQAPEEGQTLFIDEDIPLTADTAKGLGFRNATVHKGAYAFSGNKSVLNARLRR